MSFTWPWALAALVVIPLLLAAYLRQLRRRRRTAVRYSSVALVRSAAPKASSWKRHVPLGLVLGALALMAVAGARPTAEIDVPVSSSAVVVAVDVSGSMCATDVDPNRLAAAQQAVREFVSNQDESTRVGLVVFSGFAQIAVSPTGDRDDVLQAIDTLTTGQGTAIGSAILKSVDAISEINPDVTPADSGAGSGQDGLGDGLGDDQAPDSPTTPETPGTPQGEDGEKAPEIVVLLTDGANTRGVSPADAAAQAAERGVRVYPIGFGTRQPTTMVCSAEQLGSLADDPSGSPFGSGIGRDGRNYLTVDEPALQEVADTTGGEYFAAEDAAGLENVLNDLPTTVDIQKKDVELTAGFAGLAALLVVLALWASSRWAVYP